MSSSILFLVVLLSLLFHPNSARSLRSRITILAKSDVLLPSWVVSEFPLRAIALIYGDARSPNVHEVIDCKSMLEYVLATRMVHAVLGKITTTKVMTDVFLECTGTWESLQKVKEKAFSYDILGLGLSEAVPAGLYFSEFL